MLPNIRIVSTFLKGKIDLQLTKFLIFKAQTTFTRGDITNTLLFWQMGYEALQIIFEISIFSKILIFFFFTESFSKYQVFLGGSCNPTTWRRDIAMPMLTNHGISFYNPVSTFKLFLF